MNPETSRFIEEQLANDTNPQPGAKAAEAVESYVAEEITDMEKRLETKYDEWVKETMLFSGSSTDDPTGDGQMKFDRLMSGKEAFVQEVIRRTLADKSKTIEDAVAEFDAMIKPPGKAN